MGVWRGASGCLLAYRFQQDIPEANVFLADTFAGVVKAGPIDGGYVDGAHADSKQEDVVNLARKLGVNIELLIGVFPDETGDAISKRCFRFCHIDVDIYQSAKDILEWVWPRLVVGGIVVFDDYGFTYCPGITRLVNELAYESDRLFIHNLNGHAIFVKKERSQ